MCEKNRLCVFVAIAGLMLGSFTAMADELNMNLEIDFLLDTVVSSDCVFIRNGSEYEAEAARDHLQMKRKRGKRYFSSTEEFIEKIASKSSWSGNDYLIECENESRQKAQAWFTSILKRFRAAN